MAHWQEKWEKIPVKIQKVLQIIVGILLALACTFFVFRSSTQESGSMFSFFIAFGLVLILPRVFSTQTGDPLKLMYIVMLISLVVFIGGYAIYGFTSGTMFSKSTASTIWISNPAIIGG